MNDSPDRDDRLTDFLRQHRSIVPPASSELEDRLMSEIDRLPARTRSPISRSWWRYIMVGIGSVAIGSLGIAIHHFTTPAEPSLAQIQQLNLYLEAHAQNLAIDLDPTLEDRGISTDLDVDLFSDNESDTEDS